MSSPVRFLTSERLYLRPIEQSDLPRCQLWINDPHIWRTTGVMRPMDAVAEANWHAGHDRSMTPRDLHLAIVLGDGDRHIGNTGLISIDWVNRKGETGTLIGERDSWNKGYATEAKALLLRYCFHTLNLHRVESQVVEYNEASARHLLRNGFQLEGRRRAAMFREGRYNDLLLFGLLREEWEARQQC